MPLFRFIAGSRRPAGFPGLFGIDITLASSRDFLLLLLLFKNRGPSSSSSLNILIYYQKKKKKKSFSPSPELSLLPTALPD
jgi:hypothetical protein